MNDSIAQRYEMHYIRKVEAFIQEVGEINGEGIPEVHLPLWGRDFDAAELKIAFVGIDTYYWGRDMNEFFRAAKQNLKEAIYRGKATRFGEKATFDEFGFLPEGSRFSFWNTVLRFLGQFFSVSDWNDLKTGQHEQILRSFVWAETESVERWRPRLCSEGADPKAWSKLKAASKLHLDSYSAIIDIFRPDVVIIMHWTDDEHYWDRQLTFEIMRDHVAYARDPLHGSHIFNIAHPNFFRSHARRNEMFETIAAKWNTVSPHT